MIRAKIETTTAASVIAEMGRRARSAAAQLARLNPESKNRALLAIAERLTSAAAAIRAENQKDLEAAEQGGLSGAMLDRLRLTDKRIAAMTQALRDVALLPDPVGEIFDLKTRPNGLRVGRMRMPIGVIALIYESRPNVTVDAAALCLKSGNAAILRGGKEALHSNRILGRLMDEAATAAGLPAGTVQLIPSADRELVGALLRAAEYVDLVIPRGGKELIERVAAEAAMPVIKHYDGICHVYVDECADLVMAERISLNAKLQRPSVCNAMETLVVHRAVAQQFLPAALQKMAAAGVELRGDAAARKIFPACKPATEQDWRTEYLDLTLAVRVVDSFDAAVEFINQYGSKHTDAIVTSDHARALRFLAEVDSACVHVNCSTRFSDGGEYGLGCEIGISTDKLHARGPMGLVELTTAKFIVLGDGQVRE